MSRVNFDYPDTCPKIDKAIRATESDILDFIADVLDEACPLLPRAARVEAASRYAEDLSRRISDAFETARQANIDMRSEAESQIANLKDKLADADAEIKHLEREAA